MIKTLAEAMIARGGRWLFLEEFSRQHGFDMARFVVFTALVLASTGTVLADGRQCYPRMGTISSQYEGKCPNSELKWVIFENDLGAFGRNCRDEPWSYSRAERAYYNHKTRAQLPMTDCPVMR